MSTTLINGLDHALCSLQPSLITTNNFTPAQYLVHGWAANGKNVRAKQALLYPSLIIDGLIQAAAMPIFTLYDHGRDIKQDYKEKRTGRAVAKTIGSIVTVPIKAIAAGGVSFTYVMSSLINIIPFSTISVMVKGKLASDRFIYFHNIGDKERNEAESDFNILSARTILPKYSEEKASSYATRAKKVAKQERWLAEKEKVNEQLQNILNRIPDGEDYEDIKGVLNSIIDDPSLPGETTFASMPAWQSFYELKTSLQAKQLKMAGVLWGANGLGWEVRDEHRVELERIESKLQWLEEVEISQLEDAFTSYKEEVSKERYSIIRTENIALYPAAACAYVVGCSALAALLFVTFPIGPIAFSIGFVALGGSM